MKSSLKSKQVRTQDLILEVLKLLKQAQVIMVSSSLAYTTILSLIPLLALSFAFFHTFGGTEKIYQSIEPWVLSYLAEDAGTETIQKLRQFIDNTHTGVMGITGLIGLIVTSFSMLSSIEKAINRVWQVPLRRNFFQRVSTYWFFLTLGPIGLAFIIGISASLNHPLSHYLPGGTGFFLITSLFFTGVYKWVPHCDVKWKYAVLTGCITATFWSLAKVGYSFYIARVVNYHKVYGSLGAVPILLLWIYIIWVIILSGAAITAALQNQSKRV